MGRKPAPVEAESTEELSSNAAHALEVEQDSVDQVFGGDYSEDTLQILRGAERAYIAKEKIEDPDKAPLEWALTQPNPGLLPPGAYEETLQYVQEKIEVLKALRERGGLDPEQQALVDYKRSLVDGKSYDELAWLKFHAYERGLKQLRSQEEAGPNTTAQPEVFRGQMYKDEGEYTAYSEESEWAPDWRCTGYLPYAGSASASFSGRSHAHALAVQGHPRTLQQVVPHAGGEQQHQSDDREQNAVTAWAITPRTEYHPLYLEEQRLAQQLRKQRAAQRSAFTFSLAAVLGVGLLKWWRSRQRGAAAGKGSRKPVPT